MSLLEKDILQKLLDIIIKYDVKEKKEILELYEENYNNVNDCWEIEQYKIIKYVLNTG